MANFCWKDVDSHGLTATIAEHKRVRCWINLKVIKLVGFIKRAFGFSQKKNEPPPLERQFPYDLKIKHPANRLPEQAQQPSLSLDHNRLLRPQQPTRCFSSQMFNLVGHDHKVPLRDLFVVAASMFEEKQLRQIHEKR